MSQTIDLRKKEEEESPITNAIGWMTHLSPPPRRERVLYAAGFLGFLAVIVAFLSGDVLFTIVLALAALVLILNLFRPHHPSQIAIHATGISVDDQNHHYGDMRSFWIEYEPYAKELSIEFKKAYMPRMRIPLENMNPLEIRQAMISYVPEKEHESSLLDDIARHLGI